MSISNSTWRFSSCSAHAAISHVSCLTLTGFAYFHEESDRLDERRDGLLGFFLCLSELHPAGPVPVVLSDKACRVKMISTERCQFCRNLTGHVRRPIQTLKFRIGQPPLHLTSDRRVGRRTWVVEHDNDVVEAHMDVCEYGEGALGRALRH